MVNNQGYREYLLLPSLFPPRLHFAFPNPQESGEGNGTPLQYSCLENPVDGGAWWAAVHGVAKSQTRLSDLQFHLSLSCFGEGNGNPLQCSCLENPRDGGAWWASVYGVSQSWTRLKRLSSSSSSSSNPQELDIQLNITSSERTSLDHFILIPPPVFLPPPISLLSFFFSYHISQFIGIHPFLYWKV